MVAGKGWHGAARTRPQVPCQHQGRCSCSEMGRAWALVPWSPGIDWRLDRSEASFEKFIPSFFCPYLSWNKSLCILSWDQNHPHPGLPAPEAQQTRGSSSSPSVMPVLVALVPLIGMFCVWGDFCHMPKYKPRRPEGAAPVDLL